MTRLPIRARLTAAFALAMVVVLAAAAAFVYVRLRENLDDAVNSGLRARADAVAELARDGGRLPRRDPRALDEPQESFAQSLAPSGRVLSALGDIRAPALAPAEARRVAAGAVLVLDRRLAGVDDTARVVARSVTGRQGAVVVAVGQALGDRDETLSGLLGSFAVGGALGVLAASLVGYGLATAGLRPVEAMRRRAAEVSLRDDGERLPVPAADDEVRRLGETLNDMLARLRRSFERERQFVADAGHELRTPIAIVKTELEGALRTGDYGPEVASALVAAVEESDHLAHFADDLLLLARAGEGGLAVRPEALDAAAFSASIRTRFADRAAQAARTIRLDVPHGLRMHADPLRLRQALSNLVDNALRHGAGDVVLRARPDGDGVALEVADEGAGFEAPIADRAFERFVRGESARTRGGAGLGLAIVRAVAEAHGGTAEIAGGDGAVVRVRLPSSDRSGTSPTRGADAAGASQAGLS